MLRSVGTGRITAAASPKELAARLCDSAAAVQSLGVMDGVTDETQQKFLKPHYVPARTLNNPHAPFRTCRARFVPFAICSAYSCVRLMVGHGHPMAEAQPAVFIARREM